MPAPYLKQMYAVVQFIHSFGAIWGKFALTSNANLALKYIKLMPELHFSGTIWDEFSEQH